MSENGTHVDHVIPWAFIKHDEPWNLVLTHGHCNVLKRDYLPNQRTVSILLARNEFLIESSHPLRDTLVHLTGATAQARGNFVMNIYKAALATGHPVWNEVLGFDIAEDPMYKTIIRKLYFS